MRQQQPGEARAVKKLLDCFLVLVPTSEDSSHVIVLKRLPTMRELQAAADVVSEMECAEQMAALDRRQGR